MPKASDITPKQEQVRAANQRYKAKRRLIIEDFKDQPCAHCGGEFPICAMDVHHPVEKAKTYEGFMSISKWSMTVSVDRLRAELDGCLAVCANCHRIHHFYKET